MKKFLSRKTFMLASCMAMMLAIGATNTVAQKIIQVGNGTNNSYYGVFDNYYYGDDSEHLLIASEMLAASGGPGVITSVWINVANVWPHAGANATWCIQMQNESSSVTSFTVRRPLNSWTTVFNRTTGMNNLTTFGATQGTGVNQWVEIPLDTPFNYTGGALFIRFVNGGNTAYGTSPYNMFRGRPNMTGRSICTSRRDLAIAFHCGQTNVGTNIAIGAGTTSLLLPNFRFTMEENTPGFIYTGPVTGSSPVPVIQTDQVWNQLVSTATARSVQYCNWAAASFMSFSPAEMGRKESTITDMALYLRWVARLRTNGKNALDSLFIYMRNSTSPLTGTTVWAGIPPQITMTSQPFNNFNFANRHQQMLAAGFTLVKAPWAIGPQIFNATGVTNSDLVNMPNVMNWYNTTLDTPF